MVLAMWESTYAFIQQGMASVFLSKKSLLY